MKHTLRLGHGNLQTTLDIVGSSLSINLDYNVSPLWPSENVGRYT